ncbi:MAG: AmpG family muropeptide MFS transporter [Proteobacteria bacterium]|nr:AmpG family muropeptide MFS transporter [Pseudomonadota bacterium]
MDAVNARLSGWLAALAAYRRRNTLSMLFLGFSSGLPFLLVFSTLSAWLRQAGIERSTIGMLAWVGFAYSFKFIWSPVVDRVELPVLHRLLGRRRSWMLLAQIGIGIGLMRLAAAHPAPGHIRGVALAALFLAFSSATQDIAMDAWRIESAPVELQGPMVGAYSIGYRIAMIAGGAGALAVAAGFGWHAGYGAMAALTSVGIVTTLLIHEPKAAPTRTEQAREAHVIDWLERRAHWPRSLQGVGAWFIGAVLCPLIDFFGRFGAICALLCLAFIGLYQVTEFTMGSMANPFYIDHHYTLDQIALVGKVCGFTVGILGVFLGGLLVARIGLARALGLGIVLAVLSNLSYSLLATTHTPTLLGLGVVNSLDNLALSVQGVALITFLSALTSAKYTATQYALFSSLYALPGKILEGTSGFVVERIGYPEFFLYTASLSIPALLLLLWLWRRSMAGDGPSALSTAPTGPSADVRA